MNQWKSNLYFIVNRIWHTTHDKQIHSAAEKWINTRKVNLLFTKYNNKKWDKANSMIHFIKSTQVSFFRLKSSVKKAFNAKRICLKWMCVTFAERYNICHKKTWIKANPRKHLVVKSIEFVLWLTLLEEILPTRKKNSTLTYTTTSPSPLAHQPTRIQIILWDNKFEIFRIIKRATKLQKSCGFWMNCFLFNKSLITFILLSLSKF